VTVRPRPATRAVPATREAAVPAEHSASAPIHSTLKSHHDAETSRARPPSRPREDVLADAIRVLTEAARLTRPLPSSAGAAPATGQPVSVTSGREPADWAEFVTHALAGAAANIGGIEAILAGRPGSWEADGIRNLLTSTAGHDEEHLLEHRTEALVVDVNIDELLTDMGAWEPYDAASRELARRYDAIGIAAVTGKPGDPLVEESLCRLQPATEEQERQADSIADLEEGLEQQRLEDWAWYGRALQVAIEAEAARLPGLTVPVVVHVQQEPSPRAHEQTGATSGVIDQLLTVAIQVTELPGDGRPPLSRLEATGHDSGAGQPPADSAGPLASGRT
jgi:hypothetical protein